MAEALLSIGVAISGAVAHEAIKSASSDIAAEVQLLSVVRSKMLKIKCEFDVIQAFMSYTDVWKDSDQLLETWIKHIREIAFDVEDIIDEFTYLLGQQDREETKHSGCKARYCCCSRVFQSWHDIANKLEHVVRRLDHMREMKERYGIKTRERGDSLRVAIETRRNWSEDAHSIRSSEIVGFDDYRETLQNWLIEDAEKTTTIISVWGMAGLGKTTLVTNVYKSSQIKRHFARRAWIHVSQVYGIEDILKRIIKEFRKGEEVQVPEDIDKMSQVDLIRVLKEDLRDNSYIVVLDDVWSRNICRDIIDRALKPPNRQGRIILTTRNEAVASLADKNHTMELNHYRKFKPWNSSSERLSACLPLGIVAIGSLLSVRSKEKSEWEKVVNGLDWEFNTNPDLHQWKSALALSYKDLPNYLKNRNRLIRLLIAEGFIEERGRSYTRTLDELAEENLNELVNKCMLQVVERNNFGRIKSFKMHDMMRELALSIAGKEYFCHVYEHFRRVQGKIRRLSLHQCGQNNEIKNVTVHPIRSLLLFDSVDLPLQPFRLLKVLDLQNSGFDSKHLPEAKLERLVYLQTLDLAYTRVKKLPTSITKLKYLRNLFVHTILDPTWKSYNYFRGFPAPKGIWNMENLQILQSVEATNEIMNHLEDMVQLRSFRITDVKPNHHPKLCAGIRKMENLRKLDIIAATENETDELDLDELSPPQSLKKLALRGRLKGGALPNWFSTHQNLAYVHLAWCELKDDPLPLLQTLPKLVFLALHKAYTLMELNFHEGFLKLRELRIVDMLELERLKFSENALPSLCQLNLVRCENLKAVDGMEKLTKLENAFLEEMPENLVRTLSDNPTIRVRKAAKLHKTVN
ncbi:unnamed protein product [Spirodela intermedia]|uniref:Uncharacterized protein n=1 Tax=Spirodela intermedia TaxID=51605 RepID=A0A7I8JKQ7_SPIIN|nr:unnamed protein product [Spirodela intermedia]CAA6670744.1 unnamed protein product [Spirodela intermedia]